MPILSGTLRFWTDGEDPVEAVLDRVVFAFHDTWEPSLIVEERYVAQVAGRRVTYGELSGWGTGLSIAVEGSDHAALVDWVEHSLSGADRQETRVSRPDFVDSVFWDVHQRG